MTALASLYDNGAKTILGYDRDHFARKAKKRCTTCKGTGMFAERFQDFNGYMTSTPKIPCECTGYYKNKPDILRVGRPPKDEA